MYECEVMSINYRDDVGAFLANSIDIDDLISATKSNPKIKPIQRSRRRGARQMLSNASLLAPLLLAEGCLSTGKRELGLGGDGDAPNDSSAPSAGGAPTPVSAGEFPPAQGIAQDDGNFSTDVGDSLQIAASDLLANDLAPGNGTLELVRVFGAANGTVALHNGIITFTPDAGYEGPASFKYEIRGPDGVLSEATVEINVGDAGDQGSPGQASGGNAGHDGNGMNMGDGADNMMALNLVPEADATHVAVNNGSWFDPNTWANGEVPGEGAQVLISDGVTVTYDGESAVSLFTVRVDGNLDFATDINTFMEVDTFVVSMKGHVTIGTVDNPVAANVSAVIQIADNGPIDVSWDPMLLSRGVVSMGDFEVHGAEKEAFLKVATDPMAGDTSITLEAPPEGWNVGDKLVLTGTHLTPFTESLAPGSDRNITTEDEELIITSIVGNVITFNKALEFDHDTPRADLKAYVANYSRNVRFETENVDDLPVHQRGHVMFMQSDIIDIRYAEFNELGRTDKSERAFDVADLSSTQSDTNVKARYPLHLHHAGVDDLDNPVMLVGNAIWGSPGWGVVQHDSNAILADNAVYNAFGSGFVAETGNETGRWANNISILSEGVAGGPKWVDDVAAFDLGRTGSGFWFQGRLIDAVDNVAAGVPGGEGFVFMSRGNGNINVLAENLDQPESLRYLDDALVSTPSITSFAGNESIATGSGLVVIKGGPEQGNDVRSVIEDFTAWETRFGVHVQYTGRYTFKDIDVIGTDRSSGAGAAVNGFELGPNVFDMTFNNVNIDGFQNGFLFSKTLVNLNNPFDGEFGYVVIDPTITNVANDYVNRDSNDLILSSSDLDGSVLSFVSDLGAFERAPQNPAAGNIELSGTKTDSIGETEISPTWDPLLYNWYSLRGAVEQEGYWTLPDGRNVTAFDQYFSDRATGEINKVAVFVENPDTGNLNGSGGFTRVDPVNNGILDINSAAPVARTDFATVIENGSIIIDVLANDFDPDGDNIAVDGLVNPRHGRVFDNDDGTLTYIPDPNYVGGDEFYYWVEDDNGNFAKASVQVTIEI
ncbi:MAG: hypothetical protein GXP04_02740 [Alphaproteobacteria bacterium]|nr:hypothetical protein [Alphaproteobacteria bacterium]